MGLTVWSFSEPARSCFMMPLYFRFWFLTTDELSFRNLLFLVSHILATLLVSHVSSPRAVLWSSDVWSFDLVGGKLAIKWNLLAVIFFNRQRYSSQLCRRWTRRQSVMLHYFMIDGHTTDERAGSWNILEIFYKKEHSEIDHQIWYAVAAERTSQPSSSSHTH